ncbi:class A beta-lactamase-related serine hydrolase [Achromobacter sp. K91]|uniref:serine hydrolase domain-containing protein n=1 Tax=Achromobacter sp. K91 TaxID=2292262 RepID=UPI000E6652E4|nr:serine hydrolase domain-containing protein [Achromobacter sp. K91]RIJ00240.1 class A beta-lactamase-related serine hydrolase [Achromobacter sp. K91]
MARWPELDSYIEDAVSWGVPQLAAAVVGPDGLIYRGSRQQGADGSPTRSSEAPAVYWLASMSKLVTAIAVLQLWERDLLQWDAPVATWLPELASPSVLEGFSGQEPALRPAASPITLRQLMTHQSGLAYPIWQNDIARYISQRGIPMPGSGKIESLALPLVFDPGTSWMYGIGLDWAGQIVERVSGKTLEDYFQEAIFQPLEMRDTSFLVNASMRERMVDLMSRDDTGAMAPVERSFPTPETFMGGSGLYGTEDDFSKLLTALLRGGELAGRRILRTETVALLLQPQVSGTHIGILRTAMPRVAADVDLHAGAESGWALGGLVNLQVGAAGRSAGSVGWAGAANTFFWIDQKRGVAVQVMMQMLPFANPLALKTLAGAEELICGILDNLPG